MRRFLRFTLPLAAALGLIACGESGESADNKAPEEPLLTAATLGEQQVRSNAEYLATVPYASADRQRGAQQAALCRVCHSFDAGAAHMIGPNLHGFFGQPAARHPDYDYSQALREADFVWTPRAMDAWLQAPARFLPGNRMAFAGVASPADRADLIAYLLEVTSSE